LKTNLVPNTILVADDDSLVRRFISIVLTKAGFQPIQAESGAQATELLRTHRHCLALAICDIRMPGVSGLDVAAELSRVDPTLPVLIITGAVDSIAVESILLTNPNAVLTKPFTSTELIEHVNTAITAGRSARVEAATRAVETYKKPPHSQDAGSLVRARRPAQKLG
jgi:CheY-like chemotaxis protein